MRLKTIFTTFVVSLISLSTGLAANQIDLRFFTRALDTESNVMYVDIEVRTSESAKLILAGQNYRIYYDAKMLKLEAENSVSKLPGNKYTDLILLENFENVNARKAGKLNFDENLGFANFSVELKDDLNGGIILTKKDGWTTVATLKFRMLKPNGDYQIIWGREGRSKEYATAFVELAEWIEPLKTTYLDIQEYYDLDYSRNTLEVVSGPENKTMIGPNPATDYLIISLKDVLKEKSQLIVKDISGRIIKYLDVQNGIRIIHLDLSELSPATYLIELNSETAGRHFTEQIVVVD